MQLPVRTRIPNIDPDIVSFESVSTSFGDNPNDVVVKRIYDRGGNLLNTRYDREIPTKDPRTGGFLVNPKKDIESFGYSSGIYTIEYLFWRFVVGNNTTPGVFVKDVSSNKTEVKLLPINNGNALNEFDNFKNNVLPSSDISKFVNKVFDSISVDNVFSNLQPTVISQIKESYGITDGDLHDILTDVINYSKQELYERVRRKGSMSSNQVNLTLNTIIKEKLSSIFSGGNSNTNRPIIG